ncbi:MAG: hypothetical protein ACETWQ_15235 [Phycisphaerae bacterium]
MACRRWASTNEGDDPEIVLAGCGDNLTLEVMAAAQILRQEVPEWRLLKQIKKPTAFSLSRAFKNLGARSGSLFLQSVTTVHLTLGCISIRPPAHNVSSSGCATITAHLLFSFIKSKPLEFVIFSCPNLYHHRTYKNENQPTHYYRLLQSKDVNPRHYNTQKLYFFTQLPIKKPRCFLSRHREAYPRRRIG